MFRGGSRAAATSKKEHFVIIVNGFQPLSIITKRSILDVAAALDPPMMITWLGVDLFREEIFPKPTQPYSTRKMKTFLQNSLISAVVRNVQQKKSLFIQPTCICPSIFPNCFSSLHLLTTMLVTFGFQIVRYKGLSLTDTIVNLQYYY